MKQQREYMEEKRVYLNMIYEAVHQYVRRYSVAVRNARKKAMSNAEAEFFIPDDIEQFHAVEGQKKLFAYWKGKCVLAEVIGILSRENGITQKQIACWCNCDHSNVSLWVRGASMPNKYQWWSVAIAIRLPHECIPYFLLMAASSYDPFCRDDTILMEISRKNESRRTAYEELMKNKCETSAYFFQKNV